ncbi:DNA-binding response regulator [Microbispora triticiradicis]|uniref:Response regulator transcription factor n=3 Tax=Microbispora TaxID=2005 RepID=A0ABY3M037_9ACTN|nr:MULTISPECIES: response regulator transcription factor [Microbispora]RGA05073.1 DNA-binding response regulator [Microbispora triticiradicis]TLP60667.1 response regulator transcription factor [Microbispora fusca]TYB61967.1 response regulator transcription factor [Microbispora tritici]GLW26816.1 DNA-binding response regulator [Microbispora amethystogenes]
MSDPIKLLVADDHPVVQDGLSSMFARDPEFTVVGEAADGAEAVRLAETLEPDVILMDLRMAGMDGVTAIGELTRRGVSARVLVLTTYDTDSHVLPAIEAGATGYLLKDAPRDELLRAVRSAARLFITEATVKTHLLNVYAKLDVNDRAAAVAEGYNRGLLGATEPP